MNREIKFRVWDKQKKEFFSLKNGLVLMLGDRDFELGFNTKQGVYPIPDTGQKDLGLDRWALQEFTGLKDRDGKEVYEGDIVETIYDDKDKINANQIGEIIYNTPSGSYRIKCGTSLLPIVTMRFENNIPVGLLMVADKVIGNIFENPDLIKS